MSLIDKILDDMDRTREAYTKETELKQMKGFRTEWNRYVELWVDEGNADWR